MPHADFSDQIEGEIDGAAANGWIVVFLTATALESLWVRREIQYAASVGGRFIAVLLEPVRPPDQLKAIQLLDATKDVQGAVNRLVAELLTRS